MTRRFLIIVAFYLAWHFASTVAQVPAEGMLGDTAYVPPVVGMTGPCRK